MSYQLHHGDNNEVLATYPANHFDSIVTDPPAGIGFMGKEWDKNKGGRDAWIAWMQQVAAECLRVLKPGGHALVWALPRTAHWTTTAWENAGFEVRDVLAHVFGTGFPKSHALPDGWGTALKPAREDWVLLRKPLDERTVASNLAQWGTGGLNVDGCRVGTSKQVPASPRKESDKIFGTYGAQSGSESGHNPSVGRWPANFLHDGSDEVVALFLQSDARNGGNSGRRSQDSNLAGLGIAQTPVYRDTGSAARFFYCTKATAAESGEDNTHPCKKSPRLMRYLCRLITPAGGLVLDPFAGSGSTGVGALLEGFRFVGIEQEAEHVATGEKRLSNINPLLATV